MSGAGEGQAQPVGEFVAEARRHVERTMPALWIVGEVAGFVCAASGHWYFVLRDESGQIDCVMLSRDNRTAADQPSNGDKLELFGRPTLYAPRGRFQLSVRFIRPSGVGRLYQLFMRRKREWKERGWFDSARPPPLLPSCVGVVCSLSGAAVRDVLQTLRRRLPSVPVVLYPAPAQGEGAAEKIGAAIRAASRRQDCDVLLVCRGGGGMEDLWAYNEEPVVAAIVDAPMPVITGIGHEVDETLADYAADFRAETPTAAAVRAVPEGAELLRRLEERQTRLQKRMRDELDGRAQHLDWAARLLALPENLLSEKTEQLRRRASDMRHLTERRIERDERRLSDFIYRLRPPDVERRLSPINEAARRLVAAAKISVRQAATAVDGGETALKLLSPRNAMRRGYGIVSDKTGKPITDAMSLPAEVELLLYRGTARAVIKERRAPLLEDGE